MFLFTNWIIEIWLESICEAPADDNDVLNDKVMSNGNISHRRPEKPDNVLCIEISNKKIVTNDKLM